MDKLSLTLQAYCLATGALPQALLEQPALCVEEQESSSMLMSIVVVDYLRCCNDNAGMLPFF